jgi:tRNA-specific 2-thiouridylase
MTRVVVAMSGGVDSSVAALILVEQGYEVIGVTMRLWAPEGNENRCCAPQGVEEARRVAQMLGIPFYTMDLEGEFKRQVVDYFIREYASGRTPNPCLQCNRHIKFGHLLERTLALGAEYLATGHYARISEINGHYQLIKGKDPRKDQSYALYMLGQRELARLLFPLGLMTKEEVRALAQRKGLPVAHREESQDLCFVPQGDYRRFLMEHGGLEPEPGPIMDSEGHLLGRHEGLIHHTVGQRRGLGLALGTPLYVLAMDEERNALIVGPSASICRGLMAQEMKYVSQRPPSEPVEVTARVRYRAREVPAILFPLEEDRARVEFLKRQRPVAPGQGVVLYQGEELLGGGIIEKGM